MAGSVGATDRATRLRGWKEIGRWFGVDERTAKRWETTRGLPVHRVPGEPRAPVYAFAEELQNWMAAQADTRGEADPLPTSSPLSSWTLTRRRRLVLVLGLALASLLGIALLRADNPPSASPKSDHVRRLAGDQLAELSARLEHQPRTVRLRARLAQDAAGALRDVASERGATPDLWRDAAIAYRRLAVIQSAADRPSLLDRKAARASLARALALVRNDRSQSGRALRAQLLVDAARQAAADGEPDAAQGMLDDATRLIPEQQMAPGARDDWRLAASEIAQWRGDYAEAIRRAGPVLSSSGAGQSADDALRRVRALDLVGEAEFYAGDRSAALARYRSAAQLAAEGDRRWPDDIRFQWYSGRENWNVGSTLADLGQSREAIAVLAKSLARWEALSRADPEDESVATYVRAVRLSYGGALTVAGKANEAAGVLEVAVGEGRAWLSRRPEDYERQRSMVTRLAALGDALAASGRRDSACAAYGEAAEHLRAIDAAGKLNALDRGSMVSALKTGASRGCPTLQL